MRYWKIEAQAVLDGAVPIAPARYTTVHDAAALLPALTGPAFHTLVHDIKTNGLQSAIVVTSKGELLDGRNRARACWVAGVEPMYTVADPSDPVRFILSLNLARRQLTPGQTVLTLVRAGVECPTQMLPAGVSLRTFKRAAGCIVAHPEHVPSLEVGGSLASFLAKCDPQPTKKRRPLDPIDRSRFGTKVRALKAENAGLIARVERAEAESACLREVSRIEPSPAREVRSAGKRRMGAVVLISDLHIGQLTNPELVHQRNKYNLEIAELRTKAVFDGAVRLLRHHQAGGETKIAGVWLAFMGDILHGDLHGDQKEPVACSPLQAVPIALPWLESGIRTVRAEGIPVWIPWVVGNHGRDAKKVSNEAYAAHNFEHLLGCSLRDRLRDDDGIRFGLSQSEHQYFDVLGWRCHSTHGTSVRYNGGIGGISVPLLRNLPRWDTVEACDYHFLGHLHTARDFGPVVVNGAGCGYGSYAMSLPAPYEEPQQQFVLIDEQYGKCTVSQIWLPKGYAADERGLVLR